MTRLTSPALLSVAFGAVLLALAALLSLACTDPAPSSSTEGGETGEELGCDSNVAEPCHPGCKCFVGEYGSVCESTCCDSYVALPVTGGEEWTFETTPECLVKCEGPDFTCPAGMVCNTSGPVCVWAD